MFLSLLEASGLWLWTIHWSVVGVLSSTCCGCFRMQNIYLNFAFLCLRGSMFDWQKKNTVSASFPTNNRDRKEKIFTTILEVYCRSLKLYFFNQTSSKKECLSVIFHHNKLNNIKVKYAVRLYPSCGLIKGIWLWDTIKPH